MSETCRETTDLLPLFFDGELDAHQMRQIALHTARCRECENEIRELEQLHDALSASISARVDQMDLSSLWPSIERQLPRARAKSSLVARWRELWDAPAQGWWVGVPAVATAAAVAALAFALFSRTQPTVAPDAEQVATVDYANSIEQIDSDLDSVAVFHDPDTRTTLLWVSDTGPVTEDLQ